MGVIQNFYKGKLIYLGNRYRSGTVKDVTSARVSIPPQLERRENKEKGVTEYVWKVDLMASQEHWVGKKRILKENFFVNEE